MSRFDPSSDEAFIFYHYQEALRRKYDFDKVLKRERVVSSECQ